MVDKIKTIINEILIVLYSLIMGDKKTSEDNLQEKIILIPYANIFGDVVLLLDCIEEFEHLYPASEGYKVVFVCRPAIKKFLLTIYPQCTLNNEVVDWTRFARDFKYYLDVLHVYDACYEKVIVPYDHTVTNDLFVRSVRAKEKITQDYDISHNEKALSYILGKNVYSKMITVDKNISVLKRQRVLINELGNKTFKSRIPYIKPLKAKQMALPKVYAVICPTASYPPKCWPIDRFAKVADYLSEKYNCSVCVCGGNENPGIFEKISALTNDNTVLIDMLDKTDFAQWAELMRGARIALCNDSASYHLAAAVRTPAVCVAGDFACVNAPLYDPDIISANDKVPIVLYNKMPCEGCRYIGYRYGYGNDKCTEMIKNQGILKCVYDIDLSEVLGAIDMQIEKYHIDFS